MPQSHKPSSSWPLPEIRWANISSPTHDVRVFICLLFIFSSVIHYDEQTKLLTPLFVAWTWAHERDLRLAMSINSPKCGDHVEWRNSHLCIVSFSSIDCLVFRLCTIWLSCFSWLSHWLLFPLTVAPRWIASQTSWTSRRILTRHAFTLHGCSSVFFFSYTTLPDGNVSQSLLLLWTLH